VNTPALRIGAFGTGNLGDDLMLQSILLREPASRVVAYGPPRFRKPVHFISYNRFMDSPETFFPGCSAVRFGGGSLFWSEENLIAMLVIAQRAKLAGLAVSLNKVGLQGFERNERYSRLLLSIVDEVTVRESHSEAVARYLGRNDVVRERDYAFDLFPEEPVPATTKNDIPVVGINFSDIRLSSSNPEDAGFKNHIAGIFSEIARRFEGALRFKYIPFCNHQSYEPENDMRAADVLWNDSKGKISYVEDVVTTDDLVDRVREVDALLGFRFHMFVLGFALGKPVVPFVESHSRLGKYGAIARDHNCEPILYTGASQGFIVSQVEARLTRLFGATTPGDGTSPGNQDIVLE